MKKRDWNLYPYAKLVHLNRERNEKNNKIQKSLPSVISTIKTEIRSVVKVDVIEKYRRLKFRDVRRFFKSLSLEEEKELSEFLVNFYDNKSRRSNRITDEFVTRMYRKHTRTTVSQLTELVKEDKSRVMAHFVNKKTNNTFQRNELLDLEKEIHDKKQEVEQIQQLFLTLKSQTEESEIILQKIKKQKEESFSVQEEPVGESIVKTKQIADDIMGQIRESLKLENMRRGF